MYLVSMQSTVCKVQLANYPWAKELRGKIPVGKCMPGGLNTTGKTGVVQSTTTATYLACNIPTTELKIHPSQQHLSWQVKAGLSIKAVIVRHPLERLLSVYRMIFEDWCDQKRFLAKQWNNVCITDSVQDQVQGYIPKSSDAKDFSAIQFLTSMADEHQHGNDRYIQKIWQKFHPGDKLTDPQAQLKFTLGELVRFLANGSREFGQDVLEHKVLSYHWAPFGPECSISSSEASEARYTRRAERAL